MVASSQMILLSPVGQGLCQKMVLSGHNPIYDMHDSYFRLLKFEWWSSSGKLAYYCGLCAAGIYIISRCDISPVDCVFGTLVE